LETKWSNVVPDLFIYTRENDFKTLFTNVVQRQELLQQKFPKEDHNFSFIISELQITLTDKMIQDAKNHNIDFLYIPQDQIPKQRLFASQWEYAL
jgi:hypothetical protein